MIENLEYKKQHYALLNELQKRHYLGLLAIELGYYGVSEVSKSFGVHCHTIRRGKKEVESPTTPELGINKVRKSGAGRKKI